MIGIKEYNSLGSPLGLFAIFSIWFVELQNFGPMVLINVVVVIIRELHRSEDAL